MKKFLILWMFLNVTALRAQETVVMIHGFLLNKHHMVHLEKTLRSTCFDIHNFEYPSRHNTIYGHAKNLVSTLQCIAQNNCGEPIHFVSHSIGALILRCALNDPCCPPEAKMGRAVLLAPPNQGSSFGNYFQNSKAIRYFFGDKSGRELLTWGPCETSQLGEFPECMQVLVIAGKKGMYPFFGTCANDMFLLVEETKLNTFHYHIALWVTHGETLTKPQSLAITRNFLLYGN